MLVTASGRSVWCALQGQGYQDMINLVGFYKENAQILLAAFQEMGFSVSSDGDAW